MHTITALLEQPQVAALAAGVETLEVLERWIRELEYARSHQLAELSRLASKIAVDGHHQDHGELMHRSVAAEVATASHLGQRAAERRIAHAATLIDQYPNLGHALRDGVVSLRHTEVVVNAGSIISTPSARARFETEVLPLAQDLTAYQLEPHAKRLAEVYAERTLDERHAEARCRREVKIMNLDDGMAQLTATVGAVDAYAIKDRLARIAHRVREHGAAATAAGAAGAADHTDDATEALAHADACTRAADPRTLKQIEADVLVELALTGGSSAVAEQVPGTASHAFARSSHADRTYHATPTSHATGDPLSAISGRVQVSVPVFTLAEIESEDTKGYCSPAELAGYGPIPTSVARALAGGAPAWERVMTHPMSGAVMTVDRYRPNEDLKRLLGARDMHCRFPGCTRKLDHCDIDHTVPAALGGATRPENLGHLCRNHHVLKHWRFLGQSGWSPTQMPGGVYRWVSPIGREYRDIPKSTVRFRPHAPPDAQEESRTTSRVPGSTLRAPRGPSKEPETAPKEPRDPVSPDAPPGTPAGEAGWPY